MDECLLNTYEALVLKRRKRSSTDIEIGYEQNSTVTSRDVSPSIRHVGPYTVTADLTTYGGIKLGWIQGVLIPCLLNIWGVVLFLRLAWVVAQAGIGLSILIICISGVVCIITTLSLSAICTNGELQGGGVYFLVSRSLGAELGASVGIIFAFANAVAASMNTIGFCDSLNNLLKSYSVKIIDNGPNDTRIVGALALLVMCFICAVGMEWETKTQNFLITIIVTAIINFVIGTAVGPRSDDMKAQGFTGISLEVAKQNWLPDFRFSDQEYHNFFSVFAIYFPAVTGVQAGANICGDLRDPASAIPKGTLLAIAISMTSYLGMVSLSGVSALRDASGSTKDLAAGTLDSCKPNCHHGLHNNYEIMRLMALWGPLIYGGCWAATLSTALTNLLAVPRLIQALGFDRIYPGLIFFSKRYGAHGEAYRGYVLTFFVSVSFLLIADLNAIAPLITNFYLASYALINFCTFHAAFFKPLSWRPGFRFYNTWVSLAGCILCVAIMMVMSWVMALTTTFIFLILYLLVLYRKPDASWGSSTEAQKYQETIASIINITHRTESIKSFNPQLLVLAGKPESRPWLLDMARFITTVGSFMIVADIEMAKLSPMERWIRRSAGEEWVRDQKLRAFYLLLQEFDYEKGLTALLQTAGLGHITPNIALLGYKNYWDQRAHQDLLVYYRMIKLAFDYEYAVAILRVPSNMRPPKRMSTTTPSTSIDGPSTERPYVSRLAVMSTDSETDITYSTRLTAEDDDTKASSIIQSAKPSVVMSSKPSRRSASSLRKFGAYKPLSFGNRDTLDAWWLYDDGGMNILLPYIIARRAVKDKMSLRIYALPRGRGVRVDAKKYMAETLKKFRIEYTELTMVTGINETPADSTWALFNSIIKNHKSSSDDECLISDAETMRLHEKTSRHLRLRELLLENSFGADLIVVTLPYPREGISAAMYMSWLEVMSHDMPPMLFVRGNSTAVIDA